MNSNLCEHESAVAKAARTGHWSAELEAHATRCAACRETVATVQAMQSLAAPAAQAAPETAAQDATRLWCLALIERKRTEAARARTMMTVVEAAVFAVVALGVGSWLAWNWPQVSAEMTAQLSVWQASLAPALWQALWFVAGETPEASSIPSAVLLALLAVAILVAQPLLAED
jgi:hypothetical protein